ncbi:hypothetical protein QN277_023318 [Acacia crassicarpa]|uniref:AAA+ ATPase domain-containing protein n=1 Tax=Acacia crassicarpa TaxID=499986 RepID=A0AAE1KCV9_9FABA|nr:hypothetical protein QN277_023318 [Acacia crassicarpa]KAK4270260.1 hypothetical protein QN277_023318 [Acacia crassicarpa]
MESLAAVAAKIVELTVKPIVRQVGYIFCYRDNLKKLEDLANELQATKERIDHKVEAERRNLRKIEGDVLKWQESVIKTLEDAKQLWKDPHDAKVWCFPNLKSRYQHGRKAKKMTDTIVKMKGKGKFDEGVGYVPRLDITNNLPAITGSDGLESRKSVKEDIMLSLKDPKVNKIGVYGIGGVGKTTLVQEVCKKVKHDKLFDEVLMVTISHMNLERIQDEIAEQLGLRLEERTSKSGRANRVCERIKMEKTLLIILDDLREKIDLDKLGIPSLDIWEKMNPEKVEVPLKNDYKGCKLLMTSRSQDILQKNDAQKNFSLQVLNDEESWSLFEAMVGDVIKDDNFRKIATQVAQRCAGLPVLIVTIAKSLKYNEDIHYWKDTLENLKRVDSRDMKETIFSALEFNFSRLEDEVKKVFLLCGVHGTSILVSDLLKYAIGLSIFKCINTIEHARNRLRKIIIDLKASCLLVDDARAGIIKMHDIVHEVAVSMASEYAFTKIDAKLQDWPGKDILERCTHIILKRCCIQKLPERLDCPHLTFLQISSFDSRTLEIPNSFFEGMRNLEALDFTGMTIASLPISLSSLTKLKTLCLDHCSLKDMTGIGALMNLEILSLIHSSLEEFPREIKQLTKLRMLDLSRSGIGTTLPNILCKLTKIEELYMGDAAIKWDMESSSTQKRNTSLAKLGDLTRLTTLEIQIREASLLPKDIAFEKLERYKVVIGDKWEWSNNKETSRLLKVKLDSTIHWELGIKTLIKRVEDLYLDKIIGISNVLFELNGEGFPLLRHLHIQNNGEIQHIVDPIKRNQTQVLFPKLETMILHNLNNLLKICHSAVRDNSFGKLKVVRVRSCDQLVYVFSVSMVKAFSQLVEIEVSECSSVKMIISAESTDSGKTFDEKIEFLPLRSLTLQHLPTIDSFCSHELTSSLGTMENLSRVNISTPFFSAKVTFSNLETLKLSSVNVKKFWDDSSAPYLVHNLANLTVEDCSGLKYLFSSSMVGRLLNLKQLEISKCDLMEEIIATEEINGVEIGEVLFPKLEAIIIKDMQNLKTIWHLILASNSLACLKTLKVKNCEKIEKIFPEYMNGAFATLETLNVEDCKSVQEIFQLGDNADDKPQLKYITLLRLPQLKQVWSRDPRSGHCFKSLQVVRVEDCGHLENLFPFSIAEHLPQLEAITIKNAEKMKEIVSKREEPLHNVVNFVFDQLTSIVLWNLQDLQGFYAGNHSLSCSSLKELNVWKCEKLKLFKTQGMSSQGRHYDDNLSVSMQQSLFTLVEVINNLENLYISNEDAKMIFQSKVPRDQFRQLKLLRLSDFGAQDPSPYWFLQNISSLERLGIQDSSFTVIFPDERPKDENGEIEVKTRLKVLHLCRLYELQHICKEGCQLDPVLEVLECLYVDVCSSLKHLVPSSVTFNHLASLKVEDCKGLICLITSSTARSLVSLTTLKIIKCDLVEQIVEEADGESICEIAFRSLKVLELEYLPKLKMFCSCIVCCLKLPVLEKLVIRQCARMESFSASKTSTPLLREILTDEQDKKWFCEDDLNNTVNKMFQDKVAFRSAKHLELSEYCELKDSWSSYVQQGIFCYLTNLAVHKCDFLSYVLLPLNLLQALSNLEELKVSECDSLRAVFDLTIMNERGMSAKVIIHLKTIELSRLPELKHIWKINSQEEEKEDDYDEEGDIQDEQSATFHQVGLPKLETLTIEDMENLETIWHPVLTPNSMCSFETLNVKSCQKIEHIFPIYMHGAFATLQTLIVDDCNSVQEVFQLGNNGRHNGDDTTRLKNLILFRLPKLKQIWSKDPQSSLRFKSLQVVAVQGCGHLEHLFPLSVAKQLPQLERIIITNAEKMKEIVSNIEEAIDDPVKFEFDQLTSMVLWNLQDLQGFFAGNHSLSCSSLKELDVRNCEKLKLFKTQGTCSQERLFDDNLHVTMQQPVFTLQEVPELKQLWYGQDGQKIFCNLKHLVVNKCTFLSNMIFSSNLLQLLYTLEELEVARCKSLEAIFDVKALNDKEMESKGVSGLKRITLSGLANLKHIWNREAREIISFRNLQIVKVDKCPNLKYVFSPSLCQELRQLEELNIESCGVENIVANEEGFEELNFYFPLLRIFRLIRLMQVNAFYPKRYTLECPSLKVLNVDQCEALQIFTFEQIASQQHRGVCVDLPIQQALFHIEKVSKNLEELSLTEKDARRILNGNYEKKLFQRTEMLCLQSFQETPAKFLNDLIQKFPATTTLQMCHSSFETLFISKEIGHCSVENTTQIKNLFLFQLEQLEHLWNDDDSASHSLVQNLEDLHMVECSRIIRFAPPSASFKNLTCLQVKDCNGLMYFLTICTAKSLIHLTCLRVSNCQMLEEVVVTDDEQQSKEEITFESLKYLELNCLSCFKSFCSGKHNIFRFPSLVTLQVIGCPKMQNFSSGVIIAPFLKLVEVENGKKRWKKDLNTTIKQLFIDKAKGEGVEGDCIASSSINIENNQTHQQSFSTSRALSSDESKAHEIVNSGKQEMHKLPTPHTGTDTQNIFEITETLLDQASQNTSSLTKVDAALGTQDETVERPLVRATHQVTLSPSIVQDAEKIHSDVRNQEMYKKALVPSVAPIVPCSSMVDIAIDPSPSQALEAMTSSIQDEAVGTQETYESKRRFSFHYAQNVSSPTMVYETGKSDDPDISLENNSSCQPTYSAMAENRGTIDSAPSKALKAPSSSTTAVADVCNSFKELDISVHLLPHLEAGVNQHPQVLDWLNTKRRRVLASSYFSIFAEVTRILMTTQRKHLTEDDRNYIRECCTALQGVGFDESWISHVHGFIEECGDGEDLIKREVEEAEGQAPNLEAQDY